MKYLKLCTTRHAVIVAPHPDDEAIGAFYLMHRLRKRGMRVRVVIVTDGTGSHPESIRWPAPKLGARRRRESRSVLARIGIDAHATTFLGLTDGALSVMTRHDRAALRRAIMAPRGCDLLVLPARDDDHPDHRAVAAACAGLPVRRRVDYLVWPNPRSRPRRATDRLPLGHLAAAKRGAILQYRSQTGAIRDDPGGFTISRTELAAFSKPVELFREIFR